ncbi:hypothetical protein N802_06045 [Knoellia sinensis KCTC 19936]|uniref:Uncharacterized protein n=1 Tax=Knoellia sinensis KCTC 19936 TaxID=1385520 RepID=A0A0A0J574_9MICO|nr:hypothetical protein [Knoellia sinensis]KGN30766.1 hypothetical protein N802_06045 [Knoellia sinensis KCTC 19936]
MDSTLGMVALALLSALPAVVAAVRRRRPAEPLPPVLLGLELARMAEHVRLVEEGNQPRKAERLAASTLAYDLVLRDYCRSVDLPVPEGHGTLSRSQRFELESALITHGHDW